MRKHINTSANNMEKVNKLINRIFYKVKHSVLKTNIANPLMIYNLRLYLKKKMIFSLLKESRKIYPVNITFIIYNI